MEDFFKMDVFFVIATLVTVVVGVLLAVVLVYAIRFMRTANRIGETVEEEAERISADIQKTRAKMKNFKLLHLFPFFGKSEKRAATRKRKKD